MILNSKVVNRQLPAAFNLEIHRSYFASTFLIS